MKKLIYSLPFFFLAVPASASYTFIISTGAGSTNQQSVTTAPMNTSGADLIIIEICGSEGDGSPLQVPTDSKSNSWTALTEYTGANNYSKAQFYYSRPTTGGSGHTFTEGTN